MLLDGRLCGSTHWCLIIIAVVANDNHTVGNTCPTSCISSTTTVTATSCTTAGFQQRFDGTEVDVCVCVCVGGGGGGGGGGEKVHAK